MKCNKDHIKIEWDEEDLFCCPLCVRESVVTNLRQVRNSHEDYISKVLCMLQNAHMHKKPLDSDIVDIIYNDAKMEMQFNR